MRVAVARVSVYSWSVVVRSKQISFVFIILFCFLECAQCDKIIPKLSDYFINAIYSCPLSISRPQPTTVYCYCFIWLLLFLRQLLVLCVNLHIVIKTCVFVFCCHFCLFFFSSLTYVHMTWADMNALNKLVLHK